MGSVSTATREPTLRTASYFVLAALLDGPLYGYAVIKRVAALSCGKVTLSAGTLYAVLDRLNTAGLVEAVREEVVNGRARRYYRLTPRGEKMLRAEADLLATAAQVVMDNTRRRRALGVLAAGPA